MKRTVTILGICLAVIVLAGPLRANAAEKQTARASGVGFAPYAYRGTARGRLMAERAAKIVATRNLARRIGLAAERGCFRVYLPGVRLVKVVPIPGGGAMATVEITAKTGHDPDSHTRRYSQVLSGKELR